MRGLSEDHFPEPGNLFGNLTQRRQPQSEHADAIEEVRIQSLAQLFVRKVRRRYQSEVTGQLSIVAEAHVALFLDRLDQKALEVSADIPHLVEKQACPCGPWRAAPRGP